MPKMAGPSVYEEHLKGRLYPAGVCHTPSEFETISTTGRLGRRSLADYHGFHIASYAAMCQYDIAGNVTGSSVTITAAIAQDVVSSGAMTISGTIIAAGGAAVANVRQATPVPIAGEDSSTDGESYGGDTVASSSDDDIARGCLTAVATIRKDKAQPGDRIVGDMHPFRPPADRNIKPEVRNVGLMMGNWGERSENNQGPSAAKREAHDCQVMGCPAMIIVLFEATTAVAAMLARPPHHVQGKQTAVAAMHRPLSLKTGPVFAGNVHMRDWYKHHVIIGTDVKQPRYMQVFWIEMFGVCFALAFIVHSHARLYGEFSMCASWWSGEGDAGYEKKQFGFARPRWYHRAAPACPERGLGPDRARAVCGGRCRQTRASSFEGKCKSQVGDCEEEAEARSEDPRCCCPVCAGYQDEGRDHCGFAPGACPGARLRGSNRSCSGGRQLAGRRRSWPKWLGTCSDAADQQPCWPSLGPPQKSK